MSLLTASSFYDIVGYVVIAVLLGVPLVMFLTIRTLLLRAKEGPRRATRSDALRQWAHDNGFTYDPTATRLIARHYQHIPFFTQGRDRTSSNTMTASVRHNERAFTLRFGDHQYTQGTGGSVRLHKASYLVIETPFEKMPLTSIRPERPGALNAGDIDFEDAEFSDMFHVTSKRKRFAYDLLHPRMIELLKRYTAGRIEITVADRCILILDQSVYQRVDQPPAFVRKFVGVPTATDTRWSLRAFGHTIGFAQSFVEHMPEHLMREYTPESERQE